MGALAGIRLSLVVAVSLAASFGAAQLEAWTRNFGEPGAGGAAADECIGVLSGADGAVRVGRQSGSNFYVRKYTSDGSMSFETAIATPRALDMINDGSSNTIFVGEGPAGTLKIGRVNSIDGSVHYSTDFPISGAPPSTARLYYHAANNSVFVSYVAGGVTWLTRIDNSNGGGAVTIGLPWLLATDAPYMALGGDGNLVLSCESGGVVYIAKFNPVLLLGEGVTSLPFASARVRGLAVSPSDNSIFVAATARATYPDHDVWAIKLNWNLGLQWSQRFNGPGDGDDHASSIAIDGQGNLIVGGSVFDGSVHRASAMKIEPVNGDRLWTYTGARIPTPTLGGTRSDPRAVVDGTSNTLLVGEILRGGNRRDMGIYKISPNGVGEWFTWYGSTNEDESIRGFAWGQNNSFYVAGTNGPVGATDILLQKYQQATLAVSPTTVVGGTDALVTLTLADAARADGYFLPISDDASFITPTANTLFVPGGQSSSGFIVQTTPVATHSAGNISVQFGNTTFTTRLSVAAPTPSTITVTPSSIIGGSNGTVMVTLSGPAPAGGIAASLGRSNPIANVPATMYFPANQTSGSMLFSTGGVTADTPVTIYASLNNVVRTTPVTILRAKLVAVNTVGSTMVGGTTIQGTVYLDGQAAGAGAVVNLSDDSAFVTMPASVTITAGYKTATYTAATTPVTSNQTVTISAVLNGITKTTTFTLSLPIHNILITPDVIVRNSSSSGLVMLSHPAPTGGVTIALYTGAPALVGVPTSVFIPAGATSRSFTITTGNVANPTLVGVFATYNGSTKRQNVVVVP